MKLIVGLGNPGSKYEHTRHNIGFQVVDYIAKQNNVTFDKSLKKTLYSKFIKNNETIILCKPQTFMNLSGESVLEISQYFKISIDDILIIYDDLTLDVGCLRLREKGSSGGQNGMKNIINILKTDKIKRIRVGIGKNPFDAADYVLGKFTEQQQNKLNEVIPLAANAALIDKFQLAMNEYNKCL